MPQIQWRQFCILAKFNAWQINTDHLFLDTEISVTLSDYTKQINKEGFTTESYCLALPFYNPNLRVKFNC